MSLPPTLTVLSLGGGVQSSVMALMAGESLPPTGSGGAFGCAIFRFLRLECLDSLDSQQQAVSHCINVDTQCCGCNGLARKRRIISYPDGVTPDPLELLTKLQECRDSPYWNRSLSDIGGMVLLKGAEAEIERYDGQSQGDQPKEAGS